MHKTYSIYPGVTKDFFIQCLAKDGKDFKVASNVIEYADEIFLPAELALVVTTKSLVSVKLTFNDNEISQIFSFPINYNKEAALFASILSQHLKIQSILDRDIWLEGLTGAYNSFDFKIKVHFAFNVAGILIKK